MGFRSYFKDFLIKMVESLIESIDMTFPIITIGLIFFTAKKIYVAEVLGQGGEWGFSLVWCFIMILLWVTLVSKR